MSTFSADKAAFFVFDQRADKATMRRLGMAYILVRLLLLTVVIAFAAPFIMKALPNLLEMETESTEFALKIQSLANSFQAVGWLASLIFLPVFIAVYTALLRWMILGQSGGKWFGLRFGEQELHVLVVMIAITVLIAFGALFSLIPLGILVGVTAALWEAGNGTIPLVGSLVYGTLWFGALIWFSVRLSPATALTVKRGKIQVFETFAVSKGHFWSLFLAYLLQFFVLLAASIALVVTALLVSLPFLGLGLAMFGWAEPDMANVRAYIALATVPLLLITIAGLGLEYIRYAMGAGVGACLVVSDAYKEDTPASTPLAPTAPPTDSDGPDETAKPST